MRKLSITLIRSPIACLKKQIRTVEALGLRRLHHTVVHDDNPTIRGMIFRVRHMVAVKEIEPAVTETPQ